MAFRIAAPVGRLETSPPVAQEELASWAVPTLCPACKGSRGVQPHKYYNTLKPGKKSSDSFLAPSCRRSRGSGLSGGGVWFVRGGSPPDTCPGGLLCAGGVRGAPPDTPRTSGPPSGQGVAGFARPRLPKHPSIFSSTVSIFEAFCVARPCMLLGQISRRFPYLTGPFSAI